MIIFIEGKSCSHRECPASSSSHFVLSRKFGGSEFDTHDLIMDPYWSVPVYNHRPFNLSYTTIKQYNISSALLLSFNKSSRSLVWHRVQDQEYLHSQECKMFIRHKYHCGMFSRCGCFHRVATSFSAAARLAKRM